jgi:drug/metabolite transporter (DMT)-like permease
VTDPRTRKLLALAALVFASAAWGSVFLFGKLALAELSPLQVVTLRFVIASLALAPVALKQRDWPRRDDLPTFLAASAIGVPVAMLLLFTGLKLAGAVTTALLLGAFPVLLSLSAVLFDKERLGWRGWAATAASTLGVVFIVGGPGQPPGWRGPLLVLASLVCFTAWVVLSKRLMQRYSPFAVTSQVIFQGTLMLLALSLMEPWPALGTLHAGTWWSLAMLGLVCTALTYQLWNWGLREVGTHTSGVIGNLEPLTGALLGITILGEPTGLGLWVGGGLILAAAISVSL